ncbi:hypothetical protein AGR3A_Lc160058 [Agrobacterium tomkonis CFBP 6623]|uniref:Uncharacterized protein n=1 Tax=Agrobacterium tomkonis CFBP 6623 TaxID=1183432 RepID=A0A1S7RZ70_9HYPH|nr:hypothetical protein AGR3A_Lc160058 [Agrobacterium tomkonis CFBP 6623]
MPAYSPSGALAPGQLGSSGATSDKYSDVSCIVRSIRDNKSNPIKHEGERFCMMRV